MPSFCEAENVGTRPLPCTLSLCYAQAAGELIRLSAHLSFNSGLPVGSRVAPEPTKLVRLSACVSCMVVSPVEPPVTPELAESPVAASQS